MDIVRYRWEQYVHLPFDLYCMCEARPVSPNYRMSITLGLRAESAYGGPIPTINPLVPSTLG